MTKFNAENERLKRKYFEWEGEANGKSKKTINNMLNALNSFESFTGFKSFKEFNKKDVIRFKKHLRKKTNKRTGLPVSKTYLLHTLKDLMNFFRWLSQITGYKKRINLLDIDYFKLLDKEIQMARSKSTKRVPTIKQVERVINSMPFDTEIQKRDRALMAFLILTGIRVCALKSIKLKHVYLEEGYVEQDPNEVATKFSKRIVTYFFPADDVIKNIFVEWFYFLKDKKLFDYSMPLFPATRLDQDEKDQFKREFLDTRHWKSTTPIRSIVKKAFEDAGLQYYNPHSFRDSLIRLAYERCKTPEDFKAWSQNIGHNSPLTTFTSYGRIEPYNQGEIMKRLSKS